MCDRKTTTRLVWFLSITIGGGLLIVPHGQPLFFYNPTRSAPVGIFFLSGRPETATVGSFVVFPIPQSATAYVRSRSKAGRVDSRWYLIKPVIAKSSDHICVRRDRVYVNAQLLDEVIKHDSLGNPVPSWAGCRTLLVGEVFVYSPAKGSFDSRIYGPVQLSTVVGVYRPLFVWDDQENH